MKRKTLPLLLLLFLTLRLHASGPQRQPPHFAEADSVMFWDNEWSNFRLTALGVDGDLRPRPVTVGKADRKSRKEQAEQWETHVAACLVPTGGSLRVPESEQAYFAANTANAAARLWLLTGEARYLDPVERMAFNLLPGLIADRSDLPQQHTAAQTLLNIAGMAYGADAEGAYVNLYANSYARLRAGTLNLSIDQITAMPHDARVKLRIGLPRGSHRLKLRLRIPEWAMKRNFMRAPLSADEARRPLMTVYVNGREEELPTERGYLVIDRVWNNRDEVYFDFPLRPRLVQPVENGAAQRGRVAVCRGPLLYVPTQQTDGCYLARTDSLAEAEEAGPWGHTLLETDLYREEGTPQDAPAPRVPTQLMPYADAKAAQIPVTVWLTSIP